MAQEQAAIDDRAASVMHDDAADLRDVRLALDSHIDRERFETPADRVSEASLRRAFSMFPTGVVAMCAMDDGAPIGMTINSFTSVSLDPPLVSVCMARQSFTWSRLRRLPRIGLTVLGADQEALSRQLAARTGDRFSGIDFEVRPEGAVHIPGGTLWLDCSVRDRLDGGDHEIVLLEVKETTVFPHVKPLVYHQRHYLTLAPAS